MSNSRRFIYYLGSSSFYWKYYANIQTVGKSEVIAYSHSKLTFAKATSVMGSMVDIGFLIIRTICINMVSGRYLTQNNDWK